jgi:hypothetical protein
LADAARRRWFAFPLRAVLAAVALVAVASWLYWDAWPRWQWRRQQLEFEAAAKELRAGQSMHDGFVWAALHEGLPERLGTVGRFTTEAKQPVQYFSLRWPNAVYLVFWKYPTYNSDCTRVEVYRLPATPSNYTPQTDAARQAVGTRQKDMPGAIAGYRRDFVEFLIGDRRDDLGFEFELIHADPPAATERQLH